MRAEVIQVCIGEKKVPMLFTRDESGGVLRAFDDNTASQPRMPSIIAHDGRGRIIRHKFRQGTVTYG
jgi:hypothetical protein